MPRTAAEPRVLGVVDLDIHNVLGKWWQQHRHVDTVTRRGATAPVRCTRCRHPASAHPPPDPPGPCRVDAATEVAELTRALTTAKPRHWPVAEPEGAPELRACYDA
jgi:hypothetical protein